MGLWVGWACSKIMLVMVVSLVRLELGNLLLWDIRAGNMGLVFILRLKPGSGWKRTLATGFSWIVRLVILGQILVV